MQTVLDPAPDALVVIDDTHAVTLVNCSAERLLGY
jgi:PAS domain-containing protein